MQEFIALGIRSTVAAALIEQGIVEPTPVQKQSIPIVLQGKDIIVHSQTGSGKTLAFILPIIEKLDKESSDIQALIVAPTRELALQITNELQKITRSPDNLHSLAIYGGQDVEQQLKKLGTSIHIVVATPGRLLDHIRRKSISLSEVKMLVLDEADQMLHMGFLTEVEEIIEQTPKARQTLLFSATMPAEIKRIAKHYLRDPEEILIQSKNITVEKVKQYIIETSDRNKQNSLRAAIKEFHPFLGIIFCRTKRRVQKLNEDLLTLGYNTEELHGDLSQAKREAVLKRFRECSIHLLIATDVAARGLDIEGVTHVFNYDIPHDTESYIHRIGRTARAGEEGTAITFVAPKDKRYLDLIETGLNQSLPHVTVDITSYKSNLRKNKR